MIHFRPNPGLPGYVVPIGPDELDDVELEKELYPTPPVLDEEEVRPEPNPRTSSHPLLWEDYQKAYVGKNP